MKIVAKTLINDVDDKILVLTRSSTHPIYAHHLDFPGGEIELNESVVNGLIREVYEETKLLIDNDDTHILIQKSIDYHMSYETYRSNLKEKTPKIQLSWEHEKYEWMTVDELLNLPFPEGVDDYFEMVIKHLRQISQKKVRST